MLSTMLVNLIIIYFAFGSPFGVLRVTRATHLRSPGLAAAVGARFILWPIFAAASVQNWFVGQEDMAEISLERQIASIRGRMESLAYNDSSASSIFEFREIFARFTGLTMTLHSGIAASSNDLFKTVEHENIVLATACMDRRNRQRLSFHHTQARNEFVDLISVMARSQPDGNEIVELALQLAKLLNDKEIAADLSTVPRFSKALSMRAA